MISLILGVLAAGCSHVTLDASIDARKHQISGTATCHGPSGNIAIASYPDALHELEDLHDLNWDWFYPEGFDPSHLRMTHKGRDLPGAVWQDLPVGAKSYTVEFETRVPHRIGAFGLADDILYLLGGWHPVFGADRTLAPVLYHYRVQVPDDMVGFAGTQPLGRRQSVIEGRYAGVFLPALFTPQAVVEPTKHGVFVNPRSRPAALQPWTHQSGKGLMQELTDTLELGQRFAASVGVSTAPVVVVASDQREQLVELFDGGFALSRRAFAIVPWERLRKFYRLPVWRAQFFVSALEISRQREAAADVDMIADLIAVALRNGLVQTRYGGEEFAPELLEHVAIIPEIDALIFAPQVPYLDTFYDAIDERPIHRHRLDNFHHERPRGKLLYEKLRDRHGHTKVMALIQAYVQTDAPFLQVSADQLGDAALHSLRQWLGPYPNHDYQLKAVRSGPQGTSVEVSLVGPGQVSEPVTVRVTDTEGQTHTGTREGPGGILFGVASVDSVVLDPDDRLLELYRPDGTDPRYNNRNPPKWRFLLNNVSALFAVTNEQVDLAASFSLRRIHDLNYRLNFSAWRLFNSVGASAGLSYLFGEEVTPLVLSNRVSLTGTYSRLRTEGGDFVAGNQGVLSLGYLFDDRPSLLSAFNGMGLRARAALGVASQDSDALLRTSGAAGLSALKLWQLGLGQAVLTRLRADIAFGDVLPQSELRLGGRFVGARGYETNEVRGRKRVVLSTEYRHTLAANRNNGFWDILTLTRFEGAFFADAVYIPVDRPGCHQSTFYDVGYGFRLIGESLNVSPTSLAVDIGFPLNRCADEDSRAPFTVYVDFIQSFAAF